MSGQDESDAQRAVTPPSYEDSMATVYAKTSDGMAPGSPTGTSDQDELCEQRVVTPPSYADSVSSPSAKPASPFDLKYVDHGIRTDETSDVFRAKIDLYRGKWQASLERLKSNGVGKQVPPDDVDRVMVFPIQYYRAQLDYLFVDDDALTAARDFINLVFDCMLSPYMSAEHRADIRDRRICQAVNAVWFAVVSDYVRASKMGMLSTTDMSARQLLDLADQDVLEACIVRGAKKTVAPGSGYEYIEKMIRILKIEKDNNYYPFPERDLASLSATAKEALGISL
jgi:hypothetical protein